VKAPFLLERYLEDLRDRTAWAPEVPLEDVAGPRYSRAALHRIAHLWALALLDDRFDTLLFPILVTAAPLLEALESENFARSWALPAGFFRERLESGACLLFVETPAADFARWPRNRLFLADPTP
jgi:hypothetical protein